MKNIRNSLCIYMYSGVVSATAGSLCVPQALTSQQIEHIADARELLVHSIAMDTDSGYQDGQRMASLDEKAGFQAVKAAMIDLAGSIPNVDQIVSDGSLEAELIQMGRSWSTPGSGVYALQEKLQTSASELVESTGPTSRSPRVNHRRLIMNAYTLRRSEVEGMSAAERAEARLAWQSVLLLPAMVGVTEDDAVVGAEVAYQSLLVLRDSRAVPVIAERVRVDLELIGWPGRSPHMTARTCLVGAARLAITDGSVSEVEVGQLLLLVSYCQGAAPTQEDFDAFVASLNISRFLSLKGFVVDEDGTSRSAWHTDEEYEACLAEWRAALLAYPREGLTAGQVQFLDAMLDEEWE